MLIYNHDEFGYFTGLSKDVHPLQAIPFRWVNIPLPELTEGQYAQLNGKEWQIVTDRIYPKVVPQVISRRQAKQQLLLIGLLDDVAAGITAIPDETERRMARIYWEDSQEFERNHPLLISLGMSVLGLTEEQLDDLFIAASKL